MKKVKTVSGLTARSLNQNANNAILTLTSQGYEIMGLQNAKSLVGYSVLIVYENGKSIQDEIRNQAYDIYNKRFAPLIIAVLGAIGLIAYWFMRQYVLLPGIQNPIHQAFYCLAGVGISLVIIGFLQDRFQGLSLLDILLTIVLAVLGSLLFKRFALPLPFNLSEYLGYVLGLAVFVVIRSPLNRLLMKLGWLKRWYDD